ncbi:hypothetical protein CRE_30120 [Caenorhabditis remanei]|uniref:Uncharacterized protein n=1 Tax=Caenorhabditis remanei TaxID=31234 RepID=E3N623_CAERE|nr:hypothetical protein CRE_30120 [Caenorhabditis remanei]
MHDLRAVILYAHGGLIRKLSKITTLLLTKNHIVMHTTLSKQSIGKLVVDSGKSKYETENVLIYVFYPILTFYFFSKNIIEELRVIVSQLKKKDSF